MGDDPFGAGQSELHRHREDGFLPRVWQPPRSGAPGELWSVLIANGFVGAFFFVGFLLLVAFHYRADQRPEGVAARLVLYLAPFYALFYEELPTALCLTFVSLGLLWRANPRAPRVLGSRL